MKFSVSGTYLASIAFCTERFRYISPAPEGRQMQESITTNNLTDQVTRAAIEVHQIMGPGLMESVYQQCMCYELELRGIPFERQKELTIEYKGALLDCGYRLDFVVAEKLIVELQSRDNGEIDHETKLMTYLWLTGLKEGLLINFNVPILKDGIIRLEN